ncbi:MAG: RluA family pseudouridine synthase [SAR324 cluster bacterium]|nr:RluA family pseudouridine synthase [SAR324 cluster bacterium]
MGSKTVAKHTELSFQYMQVNQRPETLLGFLLRKFRYHNREEWLDHIYDGRLSVNKKEGDPNQLLKNGQIITYLRPDYLEPPVDPFFEVIYEDDDLIAVNKSGNLPTSPSGKYFKNTLVHVIKDAFGWEDLFTLHRLDRETSGVLLFAKKKESAQKMAAQFREHQVEKQYLAILSRALPFKKIFVSAPIGRDPLSLVRIKQGVIPTGKPSQTCFEELNKFGNYSKVEVKPLTGRTHQIRVHAAYLGCAIVGDKLYGLENDGFVEWLEKGDHYLREQDFPTHRQLLHASQLCFTHPSTQKKMRIEASDKILMKHLDSHFS